MVTRLDIPQRELQRRLATDNPWWRAGQGIDAEEAAWPRRAYFTQFAQLAMATSVRRAVVLIVCGRRANSTLVNTDMRSSMGC